MTENNKKLSVKMRKSIMPTFRIDIEGRTPVCNAAIMGITGVVNLSETEIILKTPREYIKIKGKYLEIGIFEMKCVEIYGEITDLSFVKRLGKRGKTQ